MWVGGTAARWRALLAARHASMRLVMVVVVVGLVSEVSAVVPAAATNRLLPAACRLPLTAATAAGALRAISGVRTLYCTDVRMHDNVRHRLRQLRLCRRLLRLLRLNPTGIRSYADSCPNGGHVDHVECMYGIFSKHPLTDLAVYPDDIVLHTADQDCFPCAPACGFPLPRPLYWCPRACRSFPPISPALFASLLLLLLPPALFPAPILHSSLTWRTNCRYYRPMSSLEDTPAMDGNCKIARPGFGEHSCTSDRASQSHMPHVDGTVRSNHVLDGTNFFVCPLRLQARTRCTPASTRTLRTASL